MPSLSEIGDLSIITTCLVLPGLLMDTLLIHYSMKSDVVKAYHVEVHLGETCILFQCADRIVMKTPSIDAISLLMFSFLIGLCLPSYFSW